jgi:hypothetical protein
MKDMRAKSAALVTICCVAAAACGAALHDAAFIATPSPTAISRELETPPTPTPSPFQPASPVPPPASPSASASGSCRIPIADISEAKGWFLTIPGGSRQDDPTSVVALPGGTPGQIGANPGLTYDRAAGVWVPVPSQWLAPGGSLYAYQGFSDTTIRAVNAVDGSSGTVVGGGGWLLMTTTDDGVYVTRSDAPGAWFIPFGGQPRVVIDHGSWQRLNTGSLWGVDANGKLARHDLTSGLEATVATVSANAWIGGFDLSGNPLLNQGGALTLVRGDGTTTTLWPGTSGSVGGRVVADGLGVWFEVGGGLVGAPGHGLYLWTPSAGARLISSPEANLAGGCA